MRQLMGESKLDEKEAMANGTTDENV